MVEYLGGKSGINVTGPGDFTCSNLYKTQYCVDDLPIEMPDRIQIKHVPGHGIVLTKSEIIYDKHCQLYNL